MNLVLVSLGWESRILLIPLWFKLTLITFSNIKLHAFHLGLRRRCIITSMWSLGENQPASVLLFPSHCKTFQIMNHGGIELPILSLLSNYRIQFNSLILDSAFREHILSLPFGLQLLNHRIYFSIYAKVTEQQNTP